MKTSAIKFRLLFVSLTLLTSSNFLIAQSGSGHNKHEENKEKIKAHKVAFLTDKLNLSSSEAEKFWPVYNENESLMNNERKDFRQNHKFKPEDIVELNDENAKKFITEQIEHEQKILNLREKYYLQLYDIITPQKVIILIEAEKEFRIELMKKVAERRGPGAGQGRGAKR